MSSMLLLFLPGHDAFAPSQYTKQLNLQSPIGLIGRTSTSPATALFARRPLLSEDDLAAPPNTAVIKAVEKLGGNDVLASGK